MKKRRNKSTTEKVNIQSSPEHDSSSLMSVELILPLFEVPITVNVFGDNEQYDLETSVPQSDGCCLYKKTGDSISNIRVCFRKKEINNGLVAHEMTHAAIHALYGVGVSVCACHGDPCEVLAYSVGWLVEKFWNWMCKREDPFESMLPHMIERAYYGSENS